MERLVGWLARHWLVIAVVLTLAVGFGIPLWFRLFVDADPPLDSDLATSRSDVPDGDNGFLLVVVDPLSVHRGPGEALREEWSPTGWDEGIIRDVLAKNSGILDRFDRSFDRPLFQVPEAKPPLDTGVSHLMGLQDVASLAAWRARLHQLTGRPAEALADWLRIVRFGRRIEESEGVLITWLVGAAIERTGLEGLAGLVNEADLDREAIDKILRGVSRDDPLSESLVTALRYEYMLARESLELPEGQPGGWLARTFYLPNETRHLLVELYRGLVEGARSLPRDRQPPPLPDRPTATLGSLELPNTLRNHGGIVLVRSAGALVNDVFWSADRLRFETTALQVLTALRAHTISEGALPGTLEPLVPQLLSGHPDDPYDGEPLRYSREKRLIWSVGEDLEDQSGEVRAGEADGTTDRPLDFLLEGPDLGLRIRF